MRLAAGVMALLQTRFPDAVVECEKALTLLSERCTGVWWEMVTARSLISWSLMYMGQFGELANRAATDLADAQQRQDVFALTNLGVGAMPHLSLARDQPDRALQELESTIARWNGEVFHIQHAFALDTRAQNPAVYRPRRRGIAPCEPWLACRASRAAPAATDHAHSVARPACEGGAGRVDNRVGPPTVPEASDGRCSQAQ